jgi:hypothetical protein
MSQMFRTWLHSPTNIRPLSRLLPNAQPLIKQLRKSGYVFAFLLPQPLPNVLGRIGHFWMFRLLNAFSTSNDPVAPLEGIHGLKALAASLGPGREELATQLERGIKSLDPLDPDQDLKYPVSVRDRAGKGGWFEKIRIYREGLVTTPLNKSLQILWELNQIQQSREALSSLSSASGRKASASFKSVGVFDMGPPGTLAAATTVVWGARDMALNTTLCTEGIADYFGVRGSHLVMLPHVGHWTPVNRMAADVWEAVIAWAVNGEEGELSAKLEDMPSAKITINS